MLHSLRSSVKTSRSTQAVLRRHISSNAARSRPKIHDFFSTRSLSSPGLNSYSSIFRHGFSKGFHPDATYQSAKMAVRTIIGLNTVVFGAWTYATNNQDQKLRQWLYENFTLSVANYNAGRYYTLITSAFSHQNLVHFLFNMFAFNAFGTLLMMIPGVGAWHIASLCIGSAVTGSLAWLYQHGITEQGRSKSSYTIVSGRMVQSSALGASGMVMGAGMAATCLMPTAPMALMFPPVTLPMWALMGIYIGIDMYFIGDGRSVVGHSAHLGGALYGLMYYLGQLRNHGGIWMFVRRMLRRRG